MKIVTKCAELSVAALDGVPPSAINAGTLFKSTTSGPYLKLNDGKFCNVYTGLIHSDTSNTSMKCFRLEKAVIVTNEEN